MDGTVYELSSRMNDLTELLQVVATNVANANTVGFKRIVAAVQNQSGQSVAPQDLQDGDAWPRFGALQVDLTPGAIRRTERPLDLALQGEGFFVLETEAGERYTRRGRIYLNREGELTDAAGNRYASDSGSLSVPAGAKTIAVGEDGTVSVDGTALGKLRVADLTDPKALVPEGAGVFAYTGPTPKDASGVSVIQGAVEESNVQAVREMVLMIDVMRSYEAGAKILKRLDGLSQSLTK